MELVPGRLYRIRSRNLPYGVFRSPGVGFIGIREKFNYLYLSTEYGTALEDLGPVPEGIEISEDSTELFKFMSEAEAKYGRGVGYGKRPGDED